MKLQPIVLLLWLFIAEACHTSIRKGKEQGDTAHPIKSITQTHSARPKEIDSIVLPAWSSFVVFVKSRNLQGLKSVSMSSIQACDSVYVISHFLGQCFNDLFDSTLLTKIADSTSIEFIDRTEIRSSFPSAVLKIANPTDNDAITLKEVVVTKVSEGSDGPWLIAFDFIPTRKGYLFYSCNSYGGPPCCH